MNSPSGKVRKREDKDEISIIQLTDGDAKVAKRSASQLRYLDDPFIAEFIRPFVRKSPIINRGTYVRTRSIDRLVEAAIRDNAGSTTQIVSLGAGSDTRFFNLKRRLGSSHVIRYHEFDFPQVAGTKARIISQTDTLRAMVHNDPSQVAIDEEAGSISSPTYSLHPMDIRDLPNSPDLPRYLDPTLPTTVISECCLIYMDLEDATTLLRWITNTFQGNGVGLILYEPIGGHDAFGKMMVRNLATRGINLKTLHAYPTLGAQTARLKECGFVSSQQAVDINFAHDHWMGRSELNRIASLEMLDEMEEWRLLASHYCLVWGFVILQGASTIFKSWDAMRSPQQESEV